MLTASIVIYVICISTCSVYHILSILQLIRCLSVPYTINQTYTTDKGQSHNIWWILMHIDWEIKWYLYPIVFTVDVFATSFYFDRCTFENNINIKNVIIYNQQHSQMDNYHAVVTLFSYLHLKHKSNIQNQIACACVQE